MSDGTESLSEGRRGQHLASTFASALRTARYYDPSNAVMQEVCAGLMSVLAENSEEEGSVSIRVHSHCVFVGKARVPTSVSTYGRFAYLVQLFETWEVNSLTFAAGLTEDELMRTLMLLSRTRRTGGEDLADMLRAEGIERVEAEMIVVKKGGTQAPTISPAVAYSAAMHLGADLGEADGSIGAGVVRRARHVTQAVVDQILSEPGSLLALTTIKDFDRYLILHSANVAVLSTVLGQRLGLDKTRLGELCLAGFLHDAGKLGVDPDVLQKPGALEPEEWEQMRRHPLLAAHALLSHQRLTTSNMRAVVVAFEHHLNYDLSGYPRTEIKDTVTLFGNIVAIADRFDALTTARVYRKVNPTPPEAIVHLVQNAGKHFDPVLVKLFVEVMGVYPPGTVVVLSTGESGVVCHPPTIGTPLDRPQVRVMVGGVRDEVVDLDERVEGGFVRDIIAVLNPSNMGQYPAVDPAVLSALT